MELKGSEVQRIKLDECVGIYEEKGSYLAAQTMVLILIIPKDSVGQILP